MCRIAGIVSSSLLPSRDAELRAMLSVLVHGGPDDEGRYSDDRVTFGHRRLSIIDLSSAGHQPMVSSSSELVISFNGEIYNYKSLREELAVLGATFATATDTEVILKAYEQWGVKSFQRLTGIFAFSLYDKANQKLFLVRDQAGVKPLYYNLSRQQLIFASEVRAFKAFDNAWKENADWKIFFLAFGSIPFPYTTLDEVYQLEPGCFLELNLADFSSAITAYRAAAVTSTPSSPGEELKNVGASIQRAVEKNLISDAPLGVLLSGGIDSSLLTLLADRQQEGIKTISINFDDAAFDEYPYQRLVLEKTKHVEHTSHRITERMFWDNLDDIWKAMDQPTIDGVNTYFVSKCARRDGLKVVLSGLGADEIFGGYASFRRIGLLKLLRTYLPFKNRVAKIIGFRKHKYRRLMFLDLPGPIGDYLFLRGIHTPNVIGALLDIPEADVWEVLKKVQVRLPENLEAHQYVSILESKIYMANQLLKDTDGMGMWHGLEIRVPFLDVELVQHVEGISPELRFREEGQKYLLTASHPKLIPPAIVNRVKKGFTFPIAMWMKNNPERFRSLTDSNNPAARKIIDGFTDGSDHWSKYWSLAVLRQFR
jgi:asparagine synthase (glutamine-hydrolysing)